MYYLVTYDVSTQTPEGCKRLRQVAKICLNYGQRVQNSVFECKVDPAQFVKFRHELLSIIKENEDSLRFYNLGKKWHEKVEHIGIKQAYDIEGLLNV